MVATRVGQRQTRDRGERVRGASRLVRPGDTNSGKREERPSWRTWRACPSSPKTRTPRRLDLSGWLDYPSWALSPHGM